jgi:hypothetical protein
MPLHHPTEPGSLLGDGVMTSTLQARFDRLKLMAHPFGDSSSFNRELSVLEALATDVHKPQELKRLWLRRKATERNQPRFDRVQSEAKAPKSLG